MIAIFPAIAAVGGMLAPALIYLFLIMAMRLVNKDRLFLAATDIALL